MNPQLTHTTRHTIHNTSSQHKTKKIPYEIEGPECDIDCVPNVARKTDLNLALNSSYAFGGNDACLVLKGT